MDQKIYEAILDSIDSPIVFVDNNHIIRHLNEAARSRYYDKRGYSNLIGKSLFDCHNPASQEEIKRLHERLLAGENEIFLQVNKDQEKITVVGVRAADGQLFGYYERFEKVTEPSPGADGN
jgi:PAS domain S-box-containing protein